MKPPRLDWLRVLIGMLPTLGGVELRGDEIAPRYTDHHQLAYYLDDTGQRQSVQSTADWAIRRRHIIANVERVMGPFPPAARRVPLDVQVVEETRVGPLTRRKLTFQSEPGDRVAGYLFLPEPRQKKYPAVLCLHQTTQAGKDETAGLRGRVDMHYALHLAQRGLVTLAIDYPGFGEHAWKLADHPEYASGSMKAIWDNTRAIDLLASLSEVDPARIGCIGHSLGGHNAMFTALFEPRIKATVSSCGFARFDHDDLPSWTGPVYMPRIASQFGSDWRRMPFDFSEIIGCLAPRAFLTCSATEDSDFAVASVRAAIDDARAVYELHEAGDRLQAYYPAAPHSFPPDARRVAEEFLLRHLK